MPQWRSFLPDRISGLNRVGAVKSYTKENLYEVIDGHAEYYISAGFNRLFVGDYGKPGGDANSPALVINIYDMVKDIQAFGVLSDESGGQTKGTSSEILYDRELTGRELFMREILCAGHGL